VTGALVQQRCLHHPDREAAYRCPGCKRYYCRECGAEHDGRMLCAACLRKLPSADGAKTGLSMRLFAASPMIGLFVAWVFFYYVGQLLLSIPTAFHQGRLP
jgi:hypothetical protein